MASLRPRRDLIMLVLVGVILGMWWITGWALLTDYRPIGAEDGSGVALPTSGSWFRLLGGALAGSGIALAIWARQPRGLVAGILGTVAAGIAGLTSGLVMWSQLALESVTPGDDIRGLWWPLANNEQVRFILIDGAEIGVATYQRWLIVTIVATIVASVALLVSAWPPSPNRKSRRQPEMADAT